VRLLGMAMMLGRQGGHGTWDAAAPGASLWSGGGQIQVGDGCHAAMATSLHSDTRLLSFL
jgi:hypothetical protein